MNPDVTADTVAAEFRSRVPQAFAFLTAAHGFEFRAIDAYDISAHSRHCVIHWYLEREAIVLALGRRRLFGERPKDFLGIEVLVACLDPDADLRFFAFREKMLTPAQVRLDVDEEAKLLQNYCTPFLRGDFSLWPSPEAVETAIKRIQSS